MSKTKIEWADQTWNVITGCTPTSEGCENCYAERMSQRLHGRFGYPDDDPFRPGTVHLDKLDQPRHWKKPRRIFVSSMGDLFHEDVDDADILSVFNVMRKANWHTFMILTKRAERMQDFMNHLAWRSPTADEIDHGARGYQAYLGEPGTKPLDHIQVGVTVENQKRADERIPYLLETPAAVRFVSCEPLLGPIDLRTFLPPMGGAGWVSAHRPVNAKPECGIDWVIAGGESGPGARPTHPDWIRSLRDQCKVAGVPFFLKSWGAWAPCRQVATDGPTHAMCTEHGHFTEFSREAMVEECNCTEWEGFRKVGKKESGRAIDEETWDQLPEEHND